MSEQTLADVEHELRGIAQRLEELEPEVKTLRARRTDLWQFARDRGVTSARLGEWSKKSQVTVRKSTKGGTDATEPSG